MLQRQIGEPSESAPCRVLIVLVEAVEQQRGVDKAIALPCNITQVSFREVILQSRQSPIQTFLRTVFNATKEIIDLGRQFFLPECIGIEAMRLGMKKRGNQGISLRVEPKQVDPEQAFLSAIIVACIMI